jgi:hypothetical protein
LYAITDDNRLVAGRRASLLNYEFLRKRLCAVEAVWGPDLPPTEYERMLGVLTREWARRTICRPYAHRCPVEIIRRAHGVAAALYRKGGRPRKKGATPKPRAWEW